MRYNKGVMVAGLREGFNFPKAKYNKDKPFVDLTDCTDIIIVDRKYFIEHFLSIYQWALLSEGK
jgi:hypothetical protein